MILTDTGPLVALLDLKDAYHTAALETVRPFSSPMLTPWPCYTETMYLLGRTGGYPLQNALWLLRAAGQLVIHETSAAEADAMMGLMHTYRDTPMDLADASLVAAAEALSIKRIFTFDAHFYIYRLSGDGVFEIIR